MKVCIAYPPLESHVGIPLLSQNRQFQWTQGRTIVFPVIPAQAATLLHQKGYEVCWLDGIAEHWSFEKWMKELVLEKPDVIFIETKTPVIKQHWRIIKKIKKKLPNVQVVLAGDHVTALPEESLQNCPVDYIISGGNYDTALLDIVSNKPKQKIVKAKNIDLNTLPLIDRNLTKWKLYAYDNGNFKYFPATYIMAGRDCWWRRSGGCTFCSWTTIFPTFSIRTVENVLDEVGHLIDLGVKEIFDDTGTFPIGEWLQKFCRGMIDRGYNKKVVFGCNMRFGYLKKSDYDLMGQAGFRFILFGLESANQKTLDRLNKGTQIDLIEDELRLMKHLYPHVTCMVGYPWESKADAENTVSFCRRLFNKGLIKSLQATIMIPYPGTQLFKEADDNGWLLTKNWDEYDMKRPVLKSEFSDEEINRLTQQIYLSAFTVPFMFKTLTSLRSVHDIQVLSVNIYKFFARLIDFS